MKAKPLSSKDAIIRRNDRIGLRTAYWEATGRRPRSTAQAAHYFGVKKP